MATVERDDGGQAFPTPNPLLASGSTGAIGGAGPYFATTPGMSLRDWFAGQAMNGFIAAMAEYREFPRGEVAARRHSAAKGAYEMADAMIAARKGGA